MEIKLKTTPSIFKIILIGIPLLIILSIICFLFLLLVTNEFEISKRWSLLLLLILTPLYLYFAYRYASKLGVLKKYDINTNIQRNIKIASTICWILCGYYILSFSFWITDIVSLSRDFSPNCIEVVYIFLGLTFCYSGYAIRKNSNKKAGFITITTCIVALVIDIFSPSLFMIWGTLKIIVLLIITIHFRDLN